MEIVTILTQAAKAVGVSPALLLSVCWVETNHRNVDVPHDGHSASRGICQVKDATASDMEPDIYPSSLSNPEVNARVAAKYLKKQIKRYNGQIWCAVDAYNKGTMKSCDSIYVRKVKEKMRKKPWIRTKKYN